MMTKPTMIVNPNSTSYHFTLVLLTMGSINAVQKEAVARPAKQTDTLDTLAAPKNSNQLRLMMAPVPSIYIISLLGKRNFVFFHQNTSPSPTAASKVL